MAETTPRKHWSESPGIKLLIIGVLALLLLIPASLVTTLVYERQSRQESVVNEIASQWGGRQTITGPMLVIPYTDRVLTDDGKLRDYRGTISVLPETLNGSGTLDPEVRYRSIYETVVYTAKLTLAGSFDLAELDKLGLDPDVKLHWEQARIALGISDMRGLAEPVEIRLAGMAHSLDPGTGNNDVLASGASAPVKFTAPGDGTTVAFETGIVLRGTEYLHFAPVGKTTDVSLSSSWPSPSFSGAFLPAEREIGKDGFSAAWQVLHLNRDYPQAWQDTAYRPNSGAFGVSLLIPADVYQQATRTTKYAIMFIAFTFIAFFLTEMLNRLNVHPVQYLMVGLALVLFYSLEISLAEHLGFDAGYLIASLATTALIALYARAVLKNGRMALWIGGLLVILYAFLYMLLQLEDYALLAGSIALFAALAVLMYFTRRIDWYGSPGKSG